MKKKMIIIIIIRQPSCQYLRILKVIKGQTEWPMHGNHFLLVALVSFRWPPPDSDIMKNK